MNILLAISASVLAYCLAVMILGRVFRRSINLNSRLNALKTVGTEEETRIRRRKVKKSKFSFLHVPQKIRADLITAGIKLQPEEYLMMWICASILPALLAFAISGNIFACLIFVVIGAALPPIIVSIAHKKRIEKFNAQLGDALMIISNSLRAGFSFEQAIANIARDLPEPLGYEFMQASRELELGVNLEEVLNKIAEHMQSKDMELLNTAVIIQRQVGGNLAEIIDNISVTIRNRIQIKRNVKTLTAQGRTSGKIIGLLPLILLTAISMINPSYMQPLFTTTYGYIMLGISVLLEIVGFLIIRKMVDIKY